MTTAHINRVTGAHSQRPTLRSLLLDAARQLTAPIPTIHCPATPPLTVKPAA